MIFVIKRNQVIITALVIMVGVAGYLNYLDNKSINNEIILNDDGEVASLIPDSNNNNNTLPANSNIDPQIGIALNEKDNNNNKDLDLDSDLDLKQKSRDNLKDNNNKNNNLSYESRFDNTGDAVFVNNSIDTSYFVQAS